MGTRALIKIKCGCESYFFAAKNDGMPESIGREILKVSNSVRKSVIWGHLEPNTKVMYFIEKIEIFYGVYSVDEDDIDRHIRKILPEYFYCINITEAWGVISSEYVSLLGVTRHSFDDINRLKTEPLQNRIKIIDKEICPHCLKVLDEEVN